MKVVSVSPLRASGDYRCCRVTFENDGELIVKQMHFGGVAETLCRGDIGKKREVLAYTITKTVLEARRDAAADPKSIRATDPEQFDLVMQVKGFKPELDKFLTV